MLPMKRSLMGGGVDISLPNVSYCEDVKDIHYNPYNTVEFYVGEITPPQTVKIYTDKTTSVPIQVSEGNKWYSYVLPKDKGLFRISGNTVNKVVVKADIDACDGHIIPNNTVEASFNGSKATDTSRYIFSGCTSLTSLDLSSFDTSNATDMMFMFNRCSSLTSLDLSSFNTSNVTSMEGMFYRCSSLTSLDLRNFNTSNVTSMSSMFSDCSGLTSLDVSSFDTSNVTIMAFMFFKCIGLTSLDVSNFNTSKVTNMNSMFGSCNSLTSLDLSKWDISEGTIITNMFKGCSKLKTIRMVGCSLNTVETIQNQLKEDNITGVTIVTE